jgi:L-2-hydroxyglutarate oxidase LhgO
MKTEVKKNLKAALASLKDDRKEIDKQIVALKSIITTVAVAAMVAVWDDKRIAELESILAYGKPTQIKSSRKRAGPRGVSSSKWTPKMRKAAKKRMREYWAKRKLHRLNASVREQEK